jgi:U3 small nucleolar RNA-associated protein 3
MVQKRKASGGASKAKGPRDYDSKDARLGPVTTFEDLADSEEEYYMEQDEILFDEGPKSKKQKRREQEEELLENNSEEEVLDYDDEGSESDDDDDDEADIKAVKSKSAKKQNNEDDENASNTGVGAAEEEDSNWWGSSRKEYYDADQIETEADALEEEKEARRLQKKKLSKMTEEDFIESEWLAEEAEEEDQNEHAVEVLKDLEIPEDMSTEERLQLLHAKFPELDHLADELLYLQPILVTLQKEAEGQPRRSLAVVQYRILGCYVAALAMYFATLTSPARDANDTKTLLDPSELRDHEVMETLLECREAWQGVKDLKAPTTAEPATSIPSPPEEDAAPQGAVEISPKLSKRSSKEKARAKATKKADRAAKKIEDSIADLSTLVTAAKKKKKVKAAAEDIPDNQSDFGEEESMDARDAADKAARKKSLKFYTSQIVQKASRRAGAGRDAGGDADIPYRERLRDRQARLTAEAIKRGQKGSKDGAELGGDSDEEGIPNAAKAGDDDDEYYDMVANRKHGEKAQKIAKAEALAAASALDRVVETEEIGEDGKRKIT